MHENHQNMITIDKVKCLCIIRVENGFIVEEQNTPGGISLKQWIFTETSDVCDFIDQLFNNEDE